MVKNFLKSHWLSAFWGNLFAILLGAVSAVLGVLIGPSLQLLLSGADPGSALNFEELFGPYLGPHIATHFGGQVSTMGAFFAILPVLLIVVASARTVMGASQWFIWERLGERLSRSLRKDIMSKYLMLFPQALLEDPHMDAQVSSLVSSDVRYVREYLVRFHGGLPREAMQVLFLFATLYFLSPSLLTLFTLGIAPVLIVISRLGKLLRKRAKAAMKDYAVLNDWLQQRLLGVETIKHYHTEAQELSFMLEKNDVLYRSLFRAETIKAATGPLIEFVAFVSISYVFYISLGKVLAHEISGAVQLSFFSTVALLSQAGGKLGKYYNTNREASAAITRIQNATALFEQHAKDMKLHVGDVKHAVVCKNLRYSYPGQQVGALSDFSFNFASGRFYCVAGASGAGKSTLLRILLGVIHPDEGEVVFSPESANLGYLPQKPFLMADSLQNNVCYPQSSGDLQAVKAALSHVELLTAVETLPQGLDAQVGFDGLTLSGGQEQRVHLARLLFHKYKVILIDEGTSALDPVTEQITYRALKELTQRGALVIMIAHRNNAFNFADEILLLDKGRLVKFGSKGELMTNPLFVKTTQYETI